MTFVFLQRATPGSDLVGSAKSHRLALGREWVGARTARFFRPAIFELNPETVGDAVDVVVVRDDLVGIDDCPVVESKPAKLLDIIPLHAVRSQRQLYRITAQGRHTLVELFESPGGDRLRKRGVSRFPGERRAMLHYSVVAVVCGRNRDRDRLTLGARQRRTPEHDRAIERDMCPHRVLVQRMTRQDCCRCSLSLRPA